MDFCKNNYAIIGIKYIHMYTDQQAADVFVSYSYKTNINLFTMCVTCVH